MPEHNPAARFWKPAACKKADAETQTYLIHMDERKIAYERAKKDYEEEWDISYESACKEMKDEDNA
jgi:hypothetical protein